MADQCGEFRFFQGIHVRIGIRIDISISIRPMITKFGKQVHPQELTQMRLIKQVLVTSLCQYNLTYYKHYISTTRVLVATKLGTMVTYLDGLMTVKSNYLWISWSFL